MAVYLKQADSAIVNERTNEKMKYYFVLALVSKEDKEKQTKQRTVIYGFECALLALTQSNQIPTADRLSGPSGQSLLW